MWVSGAQLFLSAGKIGHVIPTLQSGKGPLEGEAFGQYRGVYSAQRVLGPHPFPLPGYPVNRWCWT